MVDILTTLQQYVPMKACTATVEVPGTEDSVEVKAESMHKILLGGDQLTVERIRGARRIRSNSQHPAGRLEGFIPVAEDWHAKVCFMEVKLVVNLHFCEHISASTGLTLLFSCMCESG